MGRKSKIIELEKDILKILKDRDIGLTTKDIAIKLGISWNTANKALNILKYKNKVSRARYGRVNVWTLIQKSLKQSNQ